MKSNAPDYSVFVEGSSLVFLVVDGRDGKIRFCNQAFLDLLDKDEPDVVGEKIISLFHPQDAFSYQKSIQATLNSDLPNVTFEARVADAKGDYRWVVWNLVFAGDEWHFGGYESTKQKAKQEELLATIHHMGVGLALTDAEGRIQFMNQPAEAITGWKSRDAVGQHIDLVCKLIDGDESAPLDNPLMEAAQKGKTVMGSGRVLLMTKDGQRKEVSYAASPLPYKEKWRGGVLVFWPQKSEITVEATKSKKMGLEALSLLAGPIAHDFNNILHMVLGYMSMVRNKIPGEDEVSIENLENARTQAQRAQELTRKLLAFSEGGIFIRSAADVKRLVKEAARRALAEKESKCIFEIAPDLWPVEVDESQIDQALYELVTNAAEAMDNKGVMKISAINAEVPGGTLEVVAGDYVKITIQDQGVGIRPEILEMVVDPFFTTKQKSSGLGLATAYKIIESNHGGLLEINSTSQKGTSVSVWLKASRGAEITLTEPGIDSTEYQGEGRILVMDDEQGILDLAVDMLAELGYEADTAKDGREAIDKYKAAKEEGRPFSAVVMDLTVDEGKMGGKEAVRHILNYDPEAVCIVSSGFHTDPVMSSFKHYGFKTAVPKPYEKSELSAALHKALQDYASRN